MQIQINSPNVQVPDEFHAFIERRLTEVLAPFAEQTTRIEVHLRDENANKGGMDKRCVLEARLRHLDPVAVEVIEADETDAFRKALDKLKHLLEKRIGKLSRKRD